MKLPKYALPKVRVVSSSPLPQWPHPGSALTRGTTGLVLRCSVVPSQDGCEQALLSLVSSPTVPSSFVLTWGLCLSLPAASSGFPQISCTRETSGETSLTRDPPGCSRPLFPACTPPFSFLSPRGWGPLCVSFLSSARVLRSGGSFCFIHLCIPTA